MMRFFLGLTKFSININRFHNIPAKYVNIILSITETAKL